MGKKRERKKKQPCGWGKKVQVSERKLQTSMEILRGPEVTIFSHI